MENVKPMKDYILPHNNFRLISQHSKAIAAKTLKNSHFHPLDFYLTTPFQQTLMNIAA